MLRIRTNLRAEAERNKASKELGDEGKFTAHIDKTLFD